MFLALALVAAIQVGDWQVSRHGDAMTDRVTVMAMSDQDGEKLVFGCVAGSFVVQRQSSEVLGEGSRPRTEPSYRYDQRPPASARWNYGMRSAMMMGRDAEEFAQGLSGAQAVLTRLVTFQGETIDASYGLEGAVEAVNEVRAACNIQPLD